MDFSNDGFKAIMRETIGIMGDVQGNCFLGKATKGDLRIGRFASFKRNRFFRILYLCRDQYACGFGDKERECEECAKFPRDSIL